MTMVNWAGDWPKQLRDAIEARGCGVLEFAKQRECLSFNELASQFRPSIVVAPIQMMLFVRSYVENHDDFQWFVRSSLIRYLRKHLPSGWESPQSIDTPLHLAILSWSAAVGKTNKESVMSTLRRLKEANFPAGWTPESVTDINIQKLLDGLPFVLPQPAAQK